MYTLAERRGAHAMVTVVPAEAKVPCFNPMNTAPCIEVTPPLQSVAALISGSLHHIAPPVRGRAS
jgi:hypothetical protein